MRPILPFLRSGLQSMNPIERQIAEAVLADPEGVVASTISEFRSRCQASVGSVISFCRRLGLDGYADLKIALARELAKSSMPAFEESAGATTLERVVQYHRACLAEVLLMNEDNEVQRAADLIERARRVEFFSMGVSYPVAYGAAAKFSLFGITAFSQSDAHLQLVAAANLGRNDVAIGISASGTTEETVNCLRVAGKRGAATIAITNAVAAPLAQTADIRLYATPREIQYFEAPLASRVTQLALVDALFVALASRQHRRADRAIRRSTEALTQQRRRGGRTKLD